MKSHRVTYKQTLSVNKLRRGYFAFVAKRNANRSDWSEIDCLHLIWQMAFIGPFNGLINVIFTQIPMRRVDRGWSWKWNGPKQNDYFSLNFYFLFVRLRRQSVNGDHFIFDKITINTWIVYDAEWADVDSIWTDNRLILVLNDTGAPSLHPNWSICVHYWHLSQPFNGFTNLFGFKTDLKRFSVRQRINEHSDIESTAETCSHTTETANQIGLSIYWLIEERRVEKNEKERDKPDDKVVNRTNKKFNF